MNVGAIRAIVLLCCLPLLAVAAPTRSAPSARLWDLVRSAEWELTVRSVERRPDPLSGSDGAVVRPDGRFAVFVVDLTNRTGRPLAPESEDFALRTAEGDRAANLAATPAARAYAVGAGFLPFGDPVPPGGTVTTVVVFEIAGDAGNLILLFRPARTAIRIDECRCNLPSPVREVGSG
jgi:hypothetical protein